MPTAAPAGVPARVAWHARGRVAPAGACLTLCDLHPLVVPAGHMPRPCKPVCRRHLAGRAARPEVLCVKQPTAVVGWALASSCMAPAWPLRPRDRWHRSACAPAAEARRAQSQTARPPARPSLTRNAIQHGSKCSRRLARNKIAMCQPHPPTHPPPPNVAATSVHARLPPWQQPAARPASQAALPPTLLLCRLRCSCRGTAAPAAVAAHSPPPPQTLVPSSRPVPMLPHR